ncbi:hypothetical protein HZS_5580 [Henneguya salminicola]|nr:hypothetical protein HZS_5580 [Henneguya salminicola]
MLGKIFLFFGPCVLLIYIPDEFSFMTSFVRICYYEVLPVLSDEPNVEIPVVINPLDLFSEKYDPIFFKQISVSPTTFHLLSSARKKLQMLIYKSK